MWERELRKIKGLYDNRLRASQQKSSKMEQALTNQTYQVPISIKIWKFELKLLCLWEFYCSWIACCQHFTAALIDVTFLSPTFDWWALIDLEPRGAGFIMRAASCFWFYCYLITISALAPKRETASWTRSGWNQEGKSRSRGGKWKVADRNRLLKVRNQ